jgi:hypothetical protein
MVMVRFVGCAAYDLLCCESPERLKWGVKSLDPWIDYL